LIEKKGILLMLQCAIALASVTVIGFSSEQEAFAAGYTIEDKASCESLPGGSPEWIDATSTCQLNSDLDFNVSPILNVDNATLAISDGSTLKLRTIPILISSSATVEVAPGGSISCDPCSSQAYPLTNNGTLVNHGTITGRSVSGDQDFGVDNTGTIINSGVFSVNTTNYKPVAVSLHVMDRAGTVGAPVSLTGYDEDGGPFIFFVTSLPQHGFLSENPNSPSPSDLLYQPKNRFFTGSDSFTLKAFDGINEGPEATISITIHPEDEDVLAALAQGHKTPVGKSVPITLTGYDSGGAPLTFTVVSGPSHGILNGTAPDLTYTPHPDFSGTDSFDFIVNDGTNNSPPATVVIEVTDELLLRKPIGNGISGTIINSGTLDIPTDLINNGTINNDVGGVITIWDGFTFTNNELLYNNATLTLIDGTFLNNNTGTINNSGTLTLDDQLTNNGVFNNDCDGTFTLGQITGNQPVNTCDNMVIDDEFSCEFFLAAANAEWVDPDSCGTDDTVTVDSGDSLTIGSGIILEAGSIAIESGGSVANSGDTVINATDDSVNNGTITNDAGAQLSISSSGPYEFTNLGTFDNAGFFDINVPLVNNRTVTNSGNFTNSGIIVNWDEFLNSGNFTNNEILSNSGTVTNNGNFTNNDQFPSAGTFINNAGFLNNGDLSTNNNITNTGTLSNFDTIDNQGTFNNTGNITNTGTLSSSGDLFNAATFTNNAGGSLTVEAMGNITNNGLIYNNASLTIDADGLLDNTSTDTIENDCGGTITGIVSTNPAEDVCEPVADDQAVTTDEDDSVSITLTGSNLDADPVFAAAALTFTIVTPPANGALSGVAPNLTYTPHPNFNGADSFTFVANDGANNSAAATVTITVNPVAEPDVGNSGSGGGGGGGGKRVVIINNNQQQGGSPSTSSCTAGTLPDSHFKENPLDRIALCNPAFLDPFGLGISQASIGQQVSITATLTNHQQVAQDYAFIVQITDEDGTVVFIGWQEGNIESGNTADISISWTPEQAGDYTVRIFVWDGLQIPAQPLSEVSVVNIEVTE
jgi:hypothetical protein